ncbi:MAG: hypothetical protein N3G75_02470 [Methanothrix sp.]|nr:hypothetical protein [Methanothrix sp.]MCX8206680.1 hypothetical protein [Methanothrix sp.]
MLDKVFGRMSGGCCGRVVSLQQINIGGRLIGIMGMNEVFQEYFKNGKTPDDATGDELVKDLRKINHIVEGAEQLYKEAFLREYRRYYEARTK